MEAVAVAAEVTRATVYNHFRDLQDLLESVIDRQTGRALAQVSETMLTSLDEGDPEQLMIEALDAYLRAVQSSPGTWRLVLMPPEGAPKALSAKITDGRTAVLGRLASAVRPVTDREPEVRDAELTARILSAISDEYARLILIDPQRFSRERLLRHARWWISQSPLAYRSPSARP